MVELAVATGRDFAEVAGLDAHELATLLDILEARARG